MNGSSVDKSLAIDLPCVTSHKLKKKEKRISMGVWQQKSQGHFSSKNCNGCPLFQNIFIPWKVTEPAPAPDQAPVFV